MGHTYSRSAGFNNSAADKEQVDEATRARGAAIEAAMRANKASSSKDDKHKDDVAAKPGADERSSPEDRFNGAEEVKNPLDELAARVAKNVGAAFKPEVLDALVTLQARDLPA